MPSVETPYRADLCHFLRDHRYRYGSIYDGSECLE